MLRAGLNQILIEMRIASLQGGCVFRHGSHKTEWLGVCLGLVARMRRCVKPSATLATVPV